MIAERNKIIAQIGPVQELPKGIQPKLGLAKGMVKIPDDFDDSLPEFEKDFWGE